MLMRRRGARSAERLAFPQDRFHFLYGPAFAGRDHVHPRASAHEHVRAYAVVRRDDRELGFRLPIERKVEVAREDLPTRVVVEFDDVALGMGFDFHGFPASVIPQARNFPQGWARLSSPIASAVAHLSASTPRRAPP